jgi:hypothetical protein
VLQTGLAANGLVIGGEGLARRARLRIDLDTMQSSWSPMMQRSTRGSGEDSKATRRAEVNHILEALCQAPPGGLRRRELARRVGARRWGPGRLGGALRQAIAEGLVREVGFRVYDLADPGRKRR